MYCRRLLSRGTPTSPMTVVHFTFEREAHLTLAIFNFFSKTSDIIFRHIHSGIWTRIRLSKSNLEEHTLCIQSYAAECYSHIFIDCQYSSKIWDEAQIFITAIFPEAISLNKARCIAAGYADGRQCKSVLQCLEDGRIAFSKRHINSGIYPFTVNM